jgi:hypothetical protein
MLRSSCPSAKTSRWVLTILNFSMPFLTLAGYLRFGLPPVERLYARVGKVQLGQPPRLSRRVISA